MAGGVVPGSEPGGHDVVADVGDGQRSENGSVGTNNRGGRVVWSIHRPSVSIRGSLMCQHSGVTYDRKNLRAATPIAKKTWKENRRVMMPVVRSGGRRRVSNEQPFAPEEVYLLLD